MFIVLVLYFFCISGSKLALFLGIYVWLLVLLDSLRSYSVYAVPNPVIRSVSLHLLLTSRKISICSLYGVAWYVRLPHNWHQPRLNTLLSIDQYLGTDWILYFESTTCDVIKSYQSSCHVHQSIGHLLLFVKFWSFTIKMCLRNYVYVNCY